ncbi:hypothetical protein TVAG_432760 [Trichomonas vaginalis G3]|uniref:Uncharacterized protein n=1 Tax=Trichomonas vaginalis (strain ATCC PRA-98 / G3) TaxID=412133 RepID=A2DIR7_TRIV3|nr:hypothetical protein TVAGG3_0562470 [Trichomonas vaginalis G3]EAY19680.1 hypothetical protein TVAG_432760 [Trichomonas vaginalis G3]KAI5521300.1 hypothetical protein TVAGG3_0562470 [Trichomonas vaginalis G3]|eukprot:XP_001580666.1 hypothetical protein [Trichomonas vaginalis G3]
MLSLRLPDRIAKERPYGVKSYAKPRKASEKTRQEESDFHEEINAQFRPKESIHQNEAELMEECNFDENRTITVVGILKDKLQPIIEYFNNNSGENPKIFDTPVTKRNLNWIFIKFKSDPRKIPCVKPLIEIEKNYCVGCFYGMFRAEILENHEKKELPVFRVWKDNQNLANVAWEHKNLWIKIREFLLGQGEIRITSQPSGIWSFVNRYF